MFSRVLAVHGGCNPVLIHKSGRGPDASYYLAAFHTRDLKGQYRNYALAFQVRAPTHVGCLLPTAMAAC